MTDEPTVDPFTVSAASASMTYDGPTTSWVTATPGPYEIALKLTLAAAFLPENLSLFLGDFRLPIVRILLIVLIFPAVSRAFFTRDRATPVWVPSDIIVLLAGIWMIVAGIVTDGFASGTKGAGALALEFTGTYYVFRHLLAGPDSSVRVIRFASKLIVVVVALALLDPLTGHLFVHDLAAAVTGHWTYFDPGSDGYVRNGIVRAMGPLEHSILFGAAAGWLGLLALCTFRFSFFSVFVGLVVLTGVWFSQSRAAVAVYILGVGLVIFHFMFINFAWRWKALLGTVFAYLVAVVTISRSPVATLLNFGGLDPEAGWYRELIWQAAGPLVLASPIFGVGLGDDWGWSPDQGLVGSSVDALWLRASMMFGIPGSVLIFLTVISAFWWGALDQSPNLSQEEQRLSVALGVVVSICVLVGFTVHFWGTCWILLGALPAIRANIAEAAIVRSQEAQKWID